jgi:hypothetical protein
MSWLFLVEVAEMRIEYHGEPDEHQDDYPRTGIFRQ